MLPTSSRPFRLALLAFLAFALVPAARPAPAYAQANVVGQWRTLASLMPINPIHVGLMHTGKILVAAGSENEQTNTTYRAAVFDPATGTTTVQTVPWDLFCNGLVFLPDGRALVVGGNLQYYPFYGLKTTTVFDPLTQQFIQVQDMAHGRWYPSNVNLNNGGTMTFSGYNETGSTNRAVEIYSVPGGWSPEALAPWTPPLYPWLHLLPNGKVFYSGSTSNSSLFDPSISTWTTNIAQTTYNQTRTYGSSVLLPLLPETGYKPQIMIMGGNDPATATAEMIDLSVATPAWHSLPPMSGPRVDMNAVMLPTGKILALGGSGQHEVASTATLQADLFDPTSQTWSPAGTAAYARLYHSVALLLPDATVWVAGSNPSDGTYEQHMEIYSPAYLFTTSSGSVVPATRPSISGAPSVVGYNSSFQVTTPDAANIAKVVFIRPGADTHGFDMEQRYVGLQFTAGSGALTVTAPPNSNIAPPGYYMLFLVNTSGVPSVATFVQLSTTPTNQPPKGTISTPSGNVTIAPGQSVTFAGSGTDPDGQVSSYNWIFPGGSPATSTAAVPGAVTFQNPGVYIVSLTVVDNQGVNDPSPPSVTVTVQSSSFTAAFTSPAAGTTVSGTTTVGMTSSAHPATYVLSIDGTQVSSQSVSGTSASYSWNTTTYTNGSHTLTLTVTDSHNTSTTTSETVTVSNGSTSFTASITYPSTGATVGGTQSVGMSTTLAWSVPKTFKLAVDGSLIYINSVSTGTTQWFDWDTTGTPNGTHTLQLTVSDSSGNSASGTLSVTVSNSASAVHASFTAPIAGSTVTGTTTVSMAVSGASGSSNTFVLSVDGTTVSTQTVSGTTASYALDTTRYANGFHTLSVTVTDATLRSATSSETVTVSNSTLPPLTASFTSPANGATVSGTVTVGMADSGASGASTFALAIDGANVSTQTVAGTTASYSWNTTTATNGSHTLTLTMTDGAGRSATASESVTVSNSTASLAASFTSPANGATVSGTVTVGMADSGASGASTFALAIDGTNVSTQTVTGTTASYSWNTTTATNGTHTLTLTVTDGAGHTATASESVTVSNSTASFTASFSYPASGATVGGGQSVGMSTTATWGQSKTFTLTVDGATITSQTLTGTTLWVTWDTTTIADGNHTLMLAVTYNGATATATLPVSVSNGGTPPPPPPLSASFTSPASGATISGNTTVGMSSSGGATGSRTFNIQFSGPSTVAPVNLTGTGTTASFSWNTTQVTNGAYTLALTVTDAAGTTATANLSVTVSNTSPPPASFTASITYPKNGAIGGGSQTVGMSTTAAWGTAKTFKLSVDSTVIVTQSSTGTTFWYQWDTTSTPNGTHTLTLTVTDGSGQAATASINVTVSN
jgi:hypothetical protein